MKRRALITILIASLLLYHAAPSLACTAFVLQAGLEQFFGSNYDWYLEDGLLMVNQQGMVKTAWPQKHEKGPPARWKAKYGSVTFVQYGRGFPKGGMNQAGLVIEGLILAGSRYPSPDQRPYFGSTSRWKQFLLDTCATVAEALSTLGRFRVSAYSSPGVHFLLADASGDAAVIEFLEGRAKVHHGPTLPLKVLTNHVYAHGLGKGAGKPARAAGFLISTRSRFATATAMLKAYQQRGRQAALRYSFKILARVARPGFTMWSVVYDQRRRRVYFRTAATKGIRWVDLGRLDFSCGRPPQVLDLQKDLSGDVTSRLQEYSPAQNHMLVKKALAATGMVLSLSNAVQIAKRLARFQDSPRCGRPAGR